MQNQTKIKKQKLEGDFPEKKDLTYWMLIIIIFAVVSYIFYQDNPTLVNAKLSLLGTVMSIALAIIAILFSFIQSNSSSNQLNKVSGDVNDLLSGVTKFTNEMQSKLEDVAKTVKSLEIVRDSLEKDNENKIKYNKEQEEKIKNTSKILDDINKTFQEMDINELSKLKEEVRKNIEGFNQEDIYTEINVFGPKSLFNSLMKYTTGETINIQALWGYLLEDGVKITYGEMINSLHTLAGEGYIEFLDNLIRVVKIPD